VRRDVDTRRMMKVSSKERRGHKNNDVGITEERWRHRKNDEGNK